MTDVPWDEQIEELEARRDLAVKWLELAADAEAREVGDDYGIPTGWLIDCALGALTSDDFDECLKYAQEWDEEKAAEEAT